MSVEMYSGSYPHHDSWLLCYRLDIVPEISVMVVVVGAVFRSLFALDFWCRSPTEKVFYTSSRGRFYTSGRTTPIFRGVVSRIGLDATPLSETMVETTDTRFNHALIYK